MCKAMVDELPPVVSQAAPRAKRRSKRPSFRCQKAKLPPRSSAKGPVEFKSARLPSQCPAGTYVEEMNPAAVDGELKGGFAPRHCIGIDTQHEQPRVGSHQFGWVDGSTHGIVIG